LSFSVKIGRLFGIDIRVHVLFLVLLGLLLLQARGAAEFTSIALVYGGVFFFVLLHELGHSVVALRCGIRVLDITLWPLGGLARLASLPRKPSTELAITVAGPLVNFALAAAFFVALFALGALPNVGGLRMIGGSLLETYLFANLAMGLFNLVPAFPLDGGRILRALLAMRLGHLRATEIAVTVSRVLAVAGVAWGIYVSWWMLVAIAAFVWTSGMTELAAARWREATSRAFGDFVARDEDADDSARSPEAAPGRNGAYPEISAERRAALDEALARLRRHPESTEPESGEPGGL
jgi:Zn-dependent protease